MHLFLKQLTRMKLDINALAIMLAKINSENSDFKEQKGRIKLKITNSMVNGYGVCRNKEKKN